MSELYTIASLSRGVSGDRAAALVPDDRFGDIFMKENSFT